MAGPNNRKRKGAIDLADFDESFLIGSISDMPMKEAAKEPVPGPGANGSHAAGSQEVKAEVPATAPSPEAVTESPAPEPVAAENSPEEVPAESSSDRVGEVAPVALATEPAGKKEDKKPKPGKAWEYDRFLTSTKGFKKSNIYISEENHHKVKSILTLLGRGVSITDYVENMFAAHWEQYGPEIQKRLSEHPFFK